MLHSFRRPRIAARPEAGLSTLHPLLWGVKHPRHIVSRQSLAIMYAPATEELLHNACEAATTSGRGEADLMKTPGNRKSRHERLQSTAAIASWGVVASAAVPEQLSGSKLNAALPQLFPDRVATPTAARRLCRRQEVRLEGAPVAAATLLEPGQTVTLVMRRGAAAVRATDAGKPGLDIEFEDDHMAIVCKPQELPTMGAGGDCVHTRLKYCLQPTKELGALRHPHHVHRLDAATGGLLLVAKTRPALVAINSALTDRTVTKRYVALVKGCLVGSGHICHPLEGKESITQYEVVAHMPSTTFGTLTRVNLWPKTGRTHQLRQHMAFAGTPILGDRRYRVRGPGLPTPAPADLAGPIEPIGSLPTTPGRPSGPCEATSSCSNPAMVAGHDVERGLAVHEAPLEVVPDSTAVSVASVEAKAAPSRLAAATVARSVGARKGSGCTASEPFALSRDGKSLGTDNPGVGGDSGDHLSECSGAGMAGPDCRHRDDVLCDGSIAPMCLWAVQLQLVHPVTAEWLDVGIADPPPSYAQIGRIEGEAVVA